MYNRRWVMILWKSFWLATTILETNSLGSVNIRLWNLDARSVWSTYDFDGTVPGAGDECVLGDGIPAHGKGLALVFMEVHDRELINI